MPQRIVFPAEGKVELQPFDLPEMGESQVRVRTRYSLMSVGTETIILQRRYDSDSHFARMFSFPQLKTGVLATGEVESVGSAVTEFSPGDRVFMRMAHGSHQVLEATQLTPVPDRIDMTSACWCGLAKTAFRAAWAAPFGLGQRVLIIGAGPVGQMAVRWARSSNVEWLGVCDLSASRLMHARNAGASVTLEGSVADHLPQVAEMNEGLGPNVVVDTTGNPDVFRLALQAVAKFGKVVLLGDTGFPGRQRLTSDVMMKGLTVQAVHDSHDRDGWNARRIDALFFDSVRRDQFPLDGLITHEFAPANCRDAYQLAVERRESALGILFDWSGEFE